MFDCLWRDGGGDGHNSAGGECGQDPAVTQADSIHLLVVADAEDDELASFANAGGIAGNACAHRLYLRAAVTAQVKGRDPVTVLAQMLHRRLTHPARADDPDALFAVVHVNRSYLADRRGLTCAARSRGNGRLSASVEGREARPHLHGPLASHRMSQQMARARLPSLAVIA